MTPLVNATGLQKRFGATVALAGVDVHAVAGECVGLVGINGSGRSTLLRVLATLIRPSSGSIEIDGLDAVRQPYEVRRRLVYLGQSTVPGYGLSVRDYLVFLLTARCEPAASPRRSALDDALARAGVAPEADLDSLSAGNRQRVALTGAYLIAPRVLLLDDPFRGLDADARHLFRLWLSEVRDAGTTIIAALNDDQDVRAICHRVIRLECGRLCSAANSSSISEQRVVSSLASAGAA